MVSASVSTIGNQPTGNHFNQNTFITQPWKGKPPPPPADPVTTGGSNTVHHQEVQE
jgi:hypothetical protein